MCKKSKCSLFGRDFLGIMAQNDFQGHMAPFTYSDRNFVRAKVKG